MGAEQSKTEKSTNLPSPEEDLSDDGSEIENQLHLLKSGDQSDVTLICGDKTFSGHTHIIGARSDVLRAIFFDLDKDRKLSISHISPNIVEILLHYMYSGEVPSISLETALKVYKAANMYAMESLKHLCKRIVQKKIRDTNAATVLTFASREDATDLKDIAVECLSSNKNYLLSESWKRYCENFPKLANDVFLAFVRKTP